MVVKQVINCKLLYFLSCISFIDVVLSSEILRPRGVSLSRASLYDPEKDFVCFDGSLTIPFSQVNDDYCDCSDASDEPGTSACPHGTFYCTNAGHKPLNIPSSRVNDGICDCCDTTDEYDSPNAKCVNNCLELGRSAREEAQRLAELIKAGQQLKTELSQQGVQLKQEKKEKFEALKKNKEEADKVKNEKEALKKEAEALENAALEKYRLIEEEERKRKREQEEAEDRLQATETFQMYDSNNDGIVEVTELQTRQTFDKDRDGEVSLEEAKYFLNDKEAVDLEEFVNDCWNIIKPFVMRDAGMFQPPIETEGQAAEADEGRETEREHEEGDEGEEDEDDEHEEEGEEAHEEEVQPIPLKYDEETQRLIDQASAARNEFNEADKAVRDIQSELTDIEEYLSKDFGPDEEYAALEGQCFEYTDHEYIYRLCPFDKSTQKQKSSSSETRLGVWGQWQGPEDDKYEEMLYDKGQSCWNGPQRSTRVRVSCGSENKVTSVTEPNRCEYLFTFTTPAACREQASDNHDVHDEL